MLSSHEFKQEKLLAQYHAARKFLLTLIGADVKDRLYSAAISELIERNSEVEKDANQKEILHDEGIQLETLIRGKQLDESLSRLAAADKSNAAVKYAIKIWNELFIIQHGINNKLIRVSLNFFLTPTPTINVYSLLLLQNLGLGINNELIKKLVAQYNKNTERKIFEALMENEDYAVMSELANLTEPENTTGLNKYILEVRKLNLCIAYNKIFRKKIKEQEVAIKSGSMVGHKEVFILREDNEKQANDLFRLAIKLFEEGHLFGRSFIEVMNALIVDLHVDVKQIVLCPKWEFVNEIMYLVRAGYPPDQINVNGKTYSTQLYLNNRPIPQNKHQGRFDAILLELGLYGATCDQSVLDLIDLEETPLTSIMQLIRMGLPFDINKILIRLISLESSAENNWAIKELFEIYNKKNKNPTVFDICAYAEYLSDKLKKIGISREKFILNNVINLINLGAPVEMFIKNDVRKAFYNFLNKANDDHVAREYARAARDPDSTLGKIIGLGAIDLTHSFELSDVLKENAAFLKSIYQSSSYAQMQPNDNLRKWFTQKGKVDWHEVRRIIVEEGANPNSSGSEIKYALAQDDNFGSTTEDIKLLTDILKHGLALNGSETHLLLKFFNVEKYGREFKKQYYDWICVLVRYGANINQATNITMLDHLVVWGAERKETSADFYHCLRQLLNCKIPLTSEKKIGAKIILKWLLEVATVNDLTPNVLLSLKAIKKELLEEMLLLEEDASFNALEQISEHPDSVLGRVFHQGGATRKSGTNLGTACEKFTKKVQEKLMKEYKNIVLGNVVNWDRIIFIFEHYKNSVHPNSVITIQDSPEFLNLTANLADFFGNLVKYKNLPDIDQTKKLLALGLDFSLSDKADNQHVCSSLYLNGYYEHAKLFLQQGVRSKQSPTFLESIIARNELHLLPDVMKYEVCLLSAPEKDFKIIVEWLYKTAKPEQITSEICRNLKPHKKALRQAILNMPIESRNAILKQIIEDENSIFGRIFRAGTNVRADKLFSVFHMIQSDYNEHCKPQVPSSFSNLVTSISTTFFGKDPFAVSTVAANSKLDKKDSDDEVDVELKLS